MKAVAMMALLCGSVLAASAGGEPVIDVVGYDVASDSVVIHGRRLTTGPMPEVTVGGSTARVVSYSPDLITAEVSQDTGRGTLAVTVTGNGRAAKGQLVLAIDVSASPVGYASSP